VTTYRIIAVATALAALGMATWLLLLAPQPLWVKAVGVPPLVLVGLLFLKRAQRGPPSN
jgi:membrane protein implicated in regulation of membrane protease activity